MDNLFRYTLAWLTFATLSLHAADTPVIHSSEIFTKALMAEETELDLEKAADLYADVIQRFDAGRERAGNAIFRRAECLRQLGDAKEAKLLYARILREFSDLSELVRLSQAKLQIDDVTLKYTNEGKEKVETFKLRELKRTPESQIPKLRTNATIIVGESIF